MYIFIYLIFMYSLLYCLSRIIHYGRPMGLPWIPWLPWIARQAHGAPGLWGKGGGPKRLYKAPTDYTKSQKDYTKPQQTIESPGILDKDIKC